MWSSLPPQLRHMFLNSSGLNRISGLCFLILPREFSRFFSMITIRLLPDVPTGAIATVLVATALLISAGCETMRESGIPGLRADTTKKYEANRVEQEHRDNFVVHRDHKSLYWLVANRIKNGMSLTDVEQILGESGERETDMGRLKLGGLYQTTDLIYKWGPDNEGYSVVLIFRDNHLVNFDPSGFRSA